MKEKAKAFDFLARTDALPHRTQDVIDLVWWDSNGHSNMTTVTGGDDPRGSLLYRACMEAMAEERATQ